VDCLKIIPSSLQGEIMVPPSKSISHRALICAGLAEGTSIIDNIVVSEDIAATCKGLLSLGAEVNSFGKRNKFLVRGNPSLTIRENRIDCGESGSTLRFLIPLGAVTGQKITFAGRGELIRRPLEPYYEIFRKLGIKYCNDNGILPLTIEGNLKPGDYFIRGDISSQFISGLMFALPLLKGNSRIFLTTDLESKAYVDLTLAVLKEFSIQIKNGGYREFRIEGNQRYVNRNYTVEGDFSQAAFWLVAGLLGGEINCLGLNRNSLQGDRKIIEIIKRMNGIVRVGKQGVEVSKSETRGITIDVSQFPDLVPILAVLGALSSGVTRLVNAGRLRLKESDRLKAISTELNKLGALVEEEGDSLIISGKEELRGGIVDSWNDHRIAMALAIASVKSAQPVIIKGKNCVNKSYPSFWDDFKRLGGRIDG
jgi:3-phosphoshikimate 1-carboxyvinyltransferase